MALAHAPSYEVPGPYRLDDVDEAFVENLFRDRVEGAELNALTVTDGHDGMTSRRRWSVEWSRTDCTRQLPESLFAKATPDGPYLRETLALLHMAENEVLFYRHVAPELGDVVPTCFYGASYPGGRFLLVVEDLEQRGCRPYWLADECSFEHARAVVTTLGSLHARFWNSPRFDSDLSFVRPRSRRFGATWHRQSMIDARTKYLASDDGQALPTDVIKLLGQWNDGFDRVIDYWDTLPPTLLHGDSHLGNTFSLPNGRAGFFDWQVVYRGHGIRDFVYFVHSALDAAALDKHGEALFDVYLQTLTAHGVAVIRHEADRLYALFLLDRWDAMIKSWARGGYGHAKTGYDRQRDSVVASLRRHATARTLEDLLAGRSS